MNEKDIEDLKNLFADVEMEVKAAKVKHPGNKALGYALMEEVGELMQAVLQYKYEGKGTPHQVYKELVQSMCMLCRLYLDGDSSVELPPIKELEF